jgi:hypothetical protein
MPVREFANKKALIDYAEQNGLVIVDVRTLRGVRRAMLFPKAVLQAEFAANREVLANKRERWRAKRVAKKAPTSARNE